MPISLTKWRSGTPPPLTLTSTQSIDSPPLEVAGVACCSHTYLLLLTLFVWKLQQPDPNSLVSIRLLMFLVLLSIGMLICCHMQISSNLCPHRFIGVWFQHMVGRIQLLPHTKFNPYVFRRFWTAVIWRITATIELSDLFEPLHPSLYTSVCKKLGTWFTGHRLCRRPLRMDVWTFGYSDALNFTEFRSRSSISPGFLLVWLFESLEHRIFLHFIDFRGISLFFYRFMWISSIWGSPGSISGDFNWFQVYLDHLRCI